MQSKSNGFINKALIIAAGQGSRLNSITNGKPKPLTRLLGLFLIERVMLNLKEVGVDHFIIVIGYLGDEIKAELGDGANYGVKITYIENNEWQKGNGISVLKAKDILSENNEKFFLLMSDHIFEAKVLENLKKINLEKDNCVLVVDKEPKQHIDLNEATKVKIEDGHIMEIGKNLEDYNGVDCGIFLLTPSTIFEALEESRKNQDDTLSGGIRILGKNRKVRTFDINGHFWIDVDTESDYLEAEKILIKKLIPDNVSIIVAWNEENT